MNSDWKVHVTALAIMAGVGVVAPAAAWIALDSSAFPLRLRDAVGAHTYVDVPVARPVDRATRVEEQVATRGTVSLREVTIKVPNKVPSKVSGAARHLGHVERPGEQICYWHRSELGSGRVRICDVPRGRSGQLKRIERIEQGDKTDLPSPTGLIRR